MKLTPHNNVHHPLLPNSLFCDGKHSVKFKGAWIRFDQLDEEARNRFIPQIINVWRANGRPDIAKEWENYQQ